jgi:hypothetical protein
MGKAGKAGLCPETGRRKTLTNAFSRKTIFGSGDCMVGGQGGGGTGQGRAGRGGDDFPETR